VSLFGEKNLLSKKLEQLHSFLDNFFVSPSHTFKIHKFNEVQTEAFQYAEGAEVNTNTSKVIVTKPILKDCDKKKQVLAFTPNIFTPGKSTTETNLMFYNAVFIDIDKGIDKDIFEGFLYPPHYVFQRKATTNKIHAYWLLQPAKATERNRKKYLAVQKYFCDTFGADESTISTVRLMRLPYTAHNKRGIKSHYQDLENNEYQDRYNLSDLFESVEHLVKPSSKKLDESEAQAIIKNFLASHDVVREGQGRTVFLYYAANLCFDWGLTEESACDLVDEFNRNLCDPPESLQHVTEQVKKTYDYTKREPGNKLNDYETEKDFAKRKKFLEREALLVAMKSFLSNWVYVSQNESFINIDNGLRFTTKQQVNAYLMPKFNTLDPYTKILSNNLIFSCDSITIEPDNDKKIFQKEGVIYYNDFRKLLLSPVPLAKNTATKKQRKAVATFLRHLRWLVPRPGELDLLLNFLSFICAKPGKKVSWAPLLVAEHKGVGRSMLSRLFKNIMGKGLVNVENTVLDKNETDYLVNTYLVFVHEVNHGSKFAVMNKLKTMITDDYVSIMAKYARTYEQPNVTNFFLLANIRDALAIEEGDRRIFVLYHDALPKAPSYYTRLDKAITENYTEIFSYLVSRDISKFNPHQRPIMTEAKRLMTNLTQTEVDLYLSDLLEQKEKPFDLPLIMPRKAYEHIVKNYPGSTKGLSQKSLTRFLLKEKYDQKSIRVHDKTYRLWSQDWAKIEKESDKDKNYVPGLIAHFIAPSDVEIN